jgi:hypothetical protein
VFSEHYRARALRVGFVRAARGVRRAAADDLPQRQGRAGAGKPRLYIDVNATDRDQDAELERLLKLGARPADIGQTGKSPGRYSPIRKATSSTCSRPALIRCDGTAG